MVLSTLVLFHSELVIYAALSDTVPRLQYLPERQHSSMLLCAGSGVYDSPLRCCICLSFFNSVQAGAGFRCY
jgi:hypothetical protein